MRLRQNGRHSPDDILKCIFWNENVWILIKISLIFFPKGRINNIPALVQIMTWRQRGDKPLSEPMMVSLPTHICVTRPQWVKLPHLEESLLHSSLVRFYSQHLDLATMISYYPCSDWSLKSQDLNNSPPSHLWRQRRSGRLHTSRVR